MSPTEDELAGDLRRLFADERLDLRPQPGVEQTIVAGARRIRRRRRVMASTGTALGAAVVIGAGMVLSGLPAHKTSSELAEQTGGDVNVVPIPPAPIPPPVTVSAPPPAPPSSPQNPSAGGPGQPPVSSPSSGGMPDLPAAGSQPLPGPVIGPIAYGGVLVGGTVEDATRAGVVLTQQNPFNTCMSYTFGGSAVPSTGTMLVNADGIVVYVNPTANTVTPDRKVGSGLTRDELRAYPGTVVSSELGEHVPTQGSINIRFVFNSADKVEHMWIEDSAKVDC